MSDEARKQNKSIFDVIEDFSASFDKLAQERHEAGAKEYGVVSFLDNDVIRMMMEELADTANYCRMQFIKLMMLQAMLEGKLEDLANDDGDITIGTESFKGTSQVGWNK